MTLQAPALCVFGSRGLGDSRVDDLIDRHMQTGGYRVLVTALDPAGVCERARHYAKASRRNIILIAVGLDASRARGMHEARSIEALKLCDCMLAIWDGHSTGTGNEIRLAEKMGVPVIIERLELPDKPTEIAELDIDALLNAVT